MRGYVIKGDISIKSHIFLDFYFTYLGLRTHEGRFKFEQTTTYCVCINNSQVLD